MHLAGDTVFLSPFSFLSSCVTELGFGWFPCSSEGDGISPSAFTLPGQPLPPPTDSLQPKALQAGPDVQPGAPQAAASTSHTLKAPAGASSWFSSCPGAPGYPRAKSSTKSCKEPPQGPWISWGRKLLLSCLMWLIPKLKAPF